MSEKSCFRGPFDRQHGKRTKHSSNLKKAPLRYLLITAKVIEFEKVSLSDIKILRLFVNILTADENYSLVNRDNLTEFGCSYLRNRKRFHNFHV